MFRLSMALGIPIGEIHERISDDDLEWYLAFSLIEPFGAIHDERRAATMMMATLAPYSKKQMTLEEASPYLADCADVGTDQETKDCARFTQAETTMRAFVSMRSTITVVPVASFEPSPRKF